MGRPIRAMIACGSGIATSTIAESQIEEICKDMNVPISITKGSVSEVAVKAEDMDVVFVTNNYKQVVACPVINVTGFIIGINIEKTKETVRSTILKLNQEING